MLLKVDGAQLEWRVKAYFSQCPVAIPEIELMDLGKFDIHSDNQAKFKLLPGTLEGRTLAKNFVYQMIFDDAFSEDGYDRPARGYSKKADYQHVSKDPKYWYKVIEAFFNKYPAFYDNSVHLIRQATETGRVVVPSGRFFLFGPEPSWDGSLDWPRTDILNHPVQGFSADLVQVARRTIWDRLQTFKYRDKVLLINTVHDDVEADVDNNIEVVYNTSLLLEKAFQDIPQEFYRKYGVKLNVPMAGEVKFGVNLNEKSMKKFKKASFEKDYMEYVQQHAN
jgi:hypothetical protein